jgi:trafficking protein particle complex subunit 8
MLYTTGDMAGAVRLFLGLLRGSATFSYNARLLQDSPARISENDKLYLDDFRVAYSVSSIIQSLQQYDIT